MRVSATLLPIALLPTILTAETSVENLLEAKLLESIKVIQGSIGGVLGVAAIDLKTNRVFQFNGDTIFPQASSIKVPIMMEAFRAARAGKLNLDAAVTLQASDSVAGSGHLRILLRSHPVTLTVRELITAMIETSDNTATNRLIAMLGMDAVNDMLMRSGFTNTRLQRRMLDSKAAAEDRENVSSPLEMARLTEMLYRGTAVDAEASRQMVAILKLVEADFRQVIPASVAVAAKPGRVDGVRAETGIVYLSHRPFVLSVMSSYLDPGENPAPDVAKLVYRHFEKLGSSNRFGHKLQ